MIWEWISLAIGLAFLGLYVHALRRRDKAPVRSRPPRDPPAAAE